MRKVKSLNLKIYQPQKAIYLFSKYLKKKSYSLHVIKINFLREIINFKITHYNIIDEK